MLFCSSIVSSSSSAKISPSLSQNSKFRGSSYLLQQQQNQRRSWSTIIDKQNDDNDSHLEKILGNNKRWVGEMLDEDPKYFDKIAKGIRASNIPTVPSPHR